MLEVYDYALKILVLSVLGFLLGLILKEEFEVDYYLAISTTVIFVGLIIYLAQILLNFYFGLNIHLVNDFQDYLANQLGGFVLAIFLGAFYDKNFK